MSWVVIASLMAPCRQAASRNSDKAAEIRKKLVLCIEGLFSSVGANILKTKPFKNKNALFVLESTPSLQNKNKSTRFVLQAE